jgi:hypothetical protein
VKGIENVFTVLCVELHPDISGTSFSKMYVIIFFSDYKIVLHSRSRNDPFTLYPEGGGRCGPNCRNGHCVLINMLYVAVWRGQNRNRQPVMILMLKSMTR